MAKLLVDLKITYYGLTLISLRGFSWGLCPFLFHWWGAGRQRLHPGLFLVESNLLVTRLTYGLIESKMLRKYVQSFEFCFLALSRRLGQVSVLIERGYIDVIV